MWSPIFSLFSLYFLSLNLSTQVTQDLLVDTIKFALILLAKLQKKLTISWSTRGVITHEKSRRKSRRKVSFLFQTKESSLWSILRLSFQGQHGTLNLSARGQAMYVNAITWDEKTTNTRSCSDKALSRITIANRGNIYILSLSLSLPGPKSPKTWFV